MHTADTMGNSGKALAKAVKEGEISIVASSGSNHIEVGYKFVSDDAELTLTALKDFSARDKISVAFFKSEKVSMYCRDYVVEGHLIITASMVESLANPKVLSLDKSSFSVLTELLEKFPDSPILGLSVTGESRSHTLFTSTQGATSLGDL
jgi:hypothetical protein